MSTSLAEYYRGAEAAAAALAQAGNDGSAAALAVHAALLPLLAGAADAARACHSGCAHCCHFPVGVTFAEASLLTACVAQQEPLRERVAAAARSTAHTPWSGLVGAPCPLLELDGRCAAYAVRPLPCRALASSDARACEAALLGEANVPRDEAAFWRGLGAAATLAALPPGGTRELRSALAAMLAVDPTTTSADAFLAARQLP